MITLYSAIGTGTNVVAVPLHGRATPAQIIIAGDLNSLATVLVEVQLPSGAYGPLANTIAGLVDEGPSNTAIGHTVALHDDVTLRTTVGGTPGAAIVEVILF